MAVRSETLNASAAGMTRLRDKGGASAQTLYELTNAYINASRTPVQRPGTTWTTQFSANTCGLVAFQGIFFAFTNDATKVVSTGSYRVALLRHPTGYTGLITKIHYAAPFMGYLYVVAEFANGDVYHYWLQNPNGWTANTSYPPNALVQPTTVNGYYYKSIQQTPPPVWAPSMAIPVIGYPGTLVQPTTYNGFYYRAFLTNMTLPPLYPINSTDYTGPNEPQWNTSIGGFTFDFSAGNFSTNPGQTPPPPTPPPSIPPGGGPGGRYGNPGGSGSGGTIGLTGRIEQK